MDGSRRAPQAERARGAVVPGKPDECRPDGRKPAGTQAIRRAASMLRHVAQGPRAGLSLRQVAETMGLSRSTTHRMLRCLVDERLVEYRDETRRYVIGGLAFELGLAAAGRQHDVMAWRPVLERLARESEATIYLMGRSLNESVCLDKCEAHSIVRVFPVEVGQRRPLGVGAGATALLAATSPGDAARVLDSVAQFLRRHTSLDVEDIRRNVEMARQTGFAESRGTVAEGVYGLGITILNGDGPATLALSLTAHISFATPERIHAWKCAMARAVGRTTAG